jgi:hypothetical protein
MVPVRLFDARTLRNNEKLKISNENDKRKPQKSQTSTIQPPQEINKIKQRTFRGH